MKRHTKVAVSAHFLLPLKHTCSINLKFAHNPYPHFMSGSLLQEGLLVIWTRFSKISTDGTTLLCNPCNVQFFSKEFSPRGGKEL